MNAKSQIDHWTKVQQEAKKAFNQFDWEKERFGCEKDKTRVKKLERLLTEDWHRRKQAESKAHHLEQQRAMKEKKMDFVDFIQAKQILSLILICFCCESISKF